MTMNWLLAHWAEITLAIMVAERIAKETPESLKIFGIPIGKYDNQIVDSVKNILKGITGKGG